jgi:uncharacterized protein
MTSLQEDPFNYPAYISIRVIGEDRNDFQSLVYSILLRNAPEVRKENFSYRPSTAGKYISITVLIEVSSRDQMEEIYQELKAEPRVLMVL